MSSFKICDRISYNPHPIANFCETYLNLPISKALGGRHFCAIKKEKAFYLTQQQKDSSHAPIYQVALTIVKIISCLTIVMPLVILAGREYFRRNLNFIKIQNQSLPKVEPTGQTEVKEVSGNIPLYHAIKKIVEAERVYWMPHPEFTEKEGPFPYKEVRILNENLYGGKGFAVIFGNKQRKMLKKGIHNDFLKWLSNESSKDQPYQPSNLSNFFQSRDSSDLFMNCSDFVYFALYQAHLITKNKILDIYDKYRAQMIQGKGKIQEDNYYGFNLKNFKTYDLSNAKGEPGDILLCFDKKTNEPIHIMVLGENNTGIGLWNNNRSKNQFRANQTPLAEIQNKYPSEANGNELYYKHCSFKDAFI